VIDIAGRLIQLTFSSFCHAEIFHAGWTLQEWPSDEILDLALQEILFT
jgi:hypothetical protein